jgi:hemolysin III
MNCLDGRSTGLTWNYDRAEIIADGVVHAIGVSFGFVGAISIVFAASNSAQSHEFVPLFIYIAGLLAMLGLSAAYNMWPVSGAKWLLRRFDHSAIYVLIAGTYTPILAQIKAGLTSSGLNIGIWSAAAIGVVLKLLLPGRFERVSIILYLLLGWSGLVENKLASFSKLNVESYSVTALCLLITIQFNGAVVVCSAIRGGQSGET